MSKFYLEAAKRGEAVQFLSDLSERWEDAHFVGVCHGDDKIVLEYDNAVEIYFIDSHFIRMKPKQREMWCFPYVLGKGSETIYTSNMYRSEEDADEMRKGYKFPVGKSQMILVDEE